MKYFTIERIKQACTHLHGFESRWVLIPLVFAVNKINDVSPVRAQGKDNAGTDKFLDRYFDGSLIGLPAFNGGRNALLPQFMDIQLESPGDFVAHKSIKIWGNHFSSRGYREMAQRGLLKIEGRSSGVKYQIQAPFWTEWNSALPTSGQTFHYEELLVWLYAFCGVPDQINSWEELSNAFQEQYLGNGGRFDQKYLSHFHTNNNVPWPSDFLTTRPTDYDFQHELLPSMFQAATVTSSLPLGTKSLREVVEEFALALRQSGVEFGTRHEEIARTFIVSMVTKPFVILTGLSGSGKTQIAIKFGEWLGNGQSLVVAVRPDWTGCEALFGYEDALDKGPNRGWFVPDVLKFMLRAAEDRDRPYLLVLDEMNLAHVERYFADVLSGIESGRPVLPNLEKGGDGAWRLRANAEPAIPMPTNLFITGTVNVDETTYMFSPKVLDRSNTIEFRVGTDELRDQDKPRSIAVGRLDSVQSLLALSRESGWQSAHRPSYYGDFVTQLKDLHRRLSEGGFEFGHRTFYEGIRYAAFYESAGGTGPTDVLDFVVLQKILPRLHGSQKKLGPTLRAVAKFCSDPSQPYNASSDTGFDPVSVDPASATLKRSFDKLRRMERNLRAYQFTSFTE